MGTGQAVRPRDLDRPQRQGILTPLRRLTTRGRAVLAAGATAICCALALGQRDLLRVGVLLLAVPLLAVIALGRSRYRLSCNRRVTPTRVQAGTAARVVLEVANVGGSRCGLVLAEEKVPPLIGTRPRFVLPGLEPGERRAITYPVRAPVRGRYPLGPLTLTLTDPFGMGQHRRAFSVRDELVVTPVVVPLAPIALRGDWSGAGDTRPRAFARSGEDDVTTREYRDGDDLRRVHWRSSARRGELMVRREEQPWQSRATLLLDRRRSAHRGHDTESTFEWAVSALASAAVHLSGRGYALRFLDGSDADRTAAQAVGSMALDWSAGDRAGAILDRLSVADLAGTVNLARACDAVQHGGTGGLVVAALGLLAEGDSRLLAPLHRFGGQCVALIAPFAGAPAGARAATTGSSSLSAPEAVHRRELDLMRSAGWDIAESVAGEPLGRTWQRLSTQRSRAPEVAR